MTKTVCTSHKRIKAFKPNDSSAESFYGNDYPEGESDSGADDRNYTYSYRARTVDGQLSDSDFGSTSDAGSSTGSP